MRVCVLGGISVIDDQDRRREVTGPRPRLILSMLAAHGGAPVGEDHLVEAIWGGEPPASARTALQTYVSALRDELEPDRPRRSPGRFIRLEPTGYRLDIDQLRVDASEFLARIEAARKVHVDDPVAAAESLDAAIAMWSEPPLGEFADQPWAIGVATRLRDTHAAALESRFGLALDDGSEGRLLDRMDEAVQTYPYRERLAGQRMLALYRCGRQRRALEQYTMTRERLRDDLGLEPGRELQLLERAILAHDPTLVSRGASPSTPTEQQAPSPRASPTRLVGRRTELSDVADLLERERCVTIVGPGGVGKSALAGAVAERVADRFAGKVVHVDFADLGGRDPLRSIAVALRVVEHPLAPLAASIADALGQAQALVVLHTCEVRVDEVGAAVAALLAAPGTRVLATSQVPMRLTDERVYRLGPLDPDAAVELLGGASESDDQRSALAQIADRVERLPLGLELARARLDALGPSELLRGLGRDRELLVGGSDRPSRQRSVQSAVEWSMDLLDAAALDALVSLSVLSAPFTIDTADALGVDMGIVGDLVDRSLAQRLDTSPTRFRLPDSVRTAARARADEARLDAARQRVAGLCLESAQARTFATDAPVEIAELDGEVIDAVAWFADRGDPRQLLLAGYLGMFFIEQGRISEGREIIADALAAHPNAPGIIRLLTSSQLGFLTWYQGDLHATTRVLADVIGLLDDAPSEEFRAVARGCLAFSERRFDDAARHLSLAAADQRGSTKQRLMVLHLAGNACWYADDRDGARRWYRQQREVARECADVFHLAQALRFEAMLTAQDGDIETAWRWAHRSLTMAQEMTDAISLAQSTAASAVVASLAQVYDEAVRHAVDAVDVGMSQFDVFALRTSVPILAEAAHRQGDDELAATLLGWYHDLLERTGQTPFPATDHLGDTAAEVRLALGPAAFAQLAAHGAAGKITDHARAVCA